MKAALPTALAALLLSSAVPASADIYRYVDERGNPCFTDNPRHGGYKVHLREGGRRPQRTSRGYYPYRTLVLEASAMYGVEEPLLRAVVEVESDYNPFALSTAGARGLMQLMPDTMRLLQVSNPWDPRQNIHGGTRYLKHLLGDLSGNLRLALAAYNAGPEAVLRHGGVPPYPQTRTYVEKVLLLYNRYAGLTD